MKLEQAIPKIPSLYNVIAIAELRNTKELREESPGTIEVRFVQESRRTHSIQAQDRLDTRQIVPAKSSRFMNWIIIYTYMNRID